MRISAYGAIKQQVQNPKEVDIVFQHWPYHINITYQVMPFAEYCLIQTNSWARDYFLNSTVRSSTNFEVEQMAPGKP